MADIWPVQRRVLIVPQQEGPVIIAVQQHVFLHAMLQIVNTDCFKAYFSRIKAVPFEVKPPETSSLRLS